MYYRLKDNIILRGWEKLPYALVNTVSGDAEFIDAEAMTAVEMCDGSIDLSLPFIPPNITKHVVTAEQKGFIEQCEAGHGLNENQKYRKYPSRYIRNVQWSITGKCNYKCRHCFMSAPDANSIQLPLEDIKEIIRQMSKCGVMNVMLTERAFSSIS